jgi:tRNA(Ile)-lysidine synthase
MTSFDRASLVLAARRHPLAHATAAGLDRARVPVGASVAVAVSGGADSMAALALLAGLAERGRVRVAAVLHIDHGLREGSALDAALVEDVARGLALDADVRRLALAPGSGVAARAREGRYLALAEMASARGVATVITAHHADDQLETMLLALVRGAGLGGLGGMPERRAMAAGIDLVRPFLRVQRSALRDAARALGVPWREDPGNERPDVPRGRIRHTVAPQLEAIARGTAERAARTAELARFGQQLLDARVDALLAADGSCARAELRGQPAALAASVVHRLVGDRLDDAEVWRAAAAAIDECTDPRRFVLADGAQLVVHARSVRVEPSAAVEGVAPSPHSAPAADASEEARQRS